MKIEQRIFVSKNTLSIAKSPESMLGIEMRSLVEGLITSYLNRSPDNSIVNMPSIFCRIQDMRLASEELVRVSAEMDVPDADGS